MTIETTHDGIAILAPLAIEARAIARVLAPADRCAVSGIGPGAALLVDTPVPVSLRAVIVAGLAGGLDPRLETGDVIVQGIEFAEGRARQGVIHTSDAIVATPAEKVRVRDATRAHVVDMEHAIADRHVRAFAPQSPIVVGVRAVADTADQTLPLFMASLVKRDGTTDAFATAWLILRRPWRVAALARAGRDASTACRALGAAVASVLEVLRTELAGPS